MYDYNKNIFQKIVLWTAKFSLERLFFQLKSFYGRKQFQVKLHFNLSENIYVI